MTTIPLPIDLMEKRTHFSIYSYFTPSSTISTTMPDNPSLCLAEDAESPVLVPVHYRGVFPHHRGTREEAGGGYVSQIGDCHGAVAHTTWISSDPTSRIEIELVRTKEQRIQQTAYFECFSRTRVLTQVAGL
jgi:hypothetical protein